MTVAAGLLVLAGLGLFVGGILTGIPALYWGCVATSAIAAVLLVLARRQVTAGPAAASPPDTAPGGRPPAPGGRPPAPGGRPPASVAHPVAEQRAPVGGLEDPPIEEVEVTDLLLVVDLRDAVLVVDEHPRYHLSGCPQLTGRPPVPLPLDEARADGFTPCAVCAPDRNIAQRARGRKAAGSA